MQRPRRGGMPMDRAFEYPAHLRAFLDDMPAAPGVYTFHGADAALPLYIGKSVNLRARVLSHLRNPDEAPLLRQTTRISHQRTAGELGALLLEARLIKERHPLMNQKLRENRQLCALRLDAKGQVDVVYARDVDFAHEAALHGLYGSRHAALDALRDLADAHRLCLGLMGLERLSPGRPCFRAMVKRCAGACAGHESPDVHHARLRTAMDHLQLVRWPYPGAVAVVERFAGDAQGLPSLEQWHVIRHWRYLGSAQGAPEARKLDVPDARFDADGYLILARSMGEARDAGTIEIVPL